MKYLQAVLIIALVKIIACQSSTIQTLVIINNILVDYDDQDSTIITNAKLNSIYDDTIYNNILDCRSGYLQIINNTNQDYMSLSYQGPPIDNNSLEITVSPNKQPLPYVQMNNETNILMYFNCPTDLANNNYWNKVTVTFVNSSSFSFKLDCDPDNRHKSFEYGYIIIAFINAFIIVAVAFHSYVWSIKINQKPLRVQLQWLYFFIFSLIAIVLIFALFLFVAKNANSAYLTLTYLGIAVSVFFVFVCLNECFFLVKAFKKPLYKFKYPRICELLSTLLTVGITVLAFYVQNWIVFDILAGFICVGCIKIFHFRSIKQIYISMFIYVVTVTMITSTLHFLLNRSYNDYATELSSPLFIMVPDFSDNLFKQCSWLSLTDIIIPGTMLSYLRLFDQNRGSRFGGVYTVVGNITFVGATIIWVLVQSVFPYSVPFCLVTYLLMMLVVFIVAWKRHDWFTLLGGTFRQDRSLNQKNLASEKQQSFSKLIPAELINDFKVLPPQSKDSNSMIKASSQ